MCPLTEYCAYIFRVAFSLFIRNDTVYGDLATRWSQDPAQHFNCRRFTCSVRTDIPDHFTGFYVEVDLIYRLFGRVLAVEQAFDRPGQTRVFLYDFIVFG
ncbi:hypothetical protein D1872_229140 [compost metagenome]